MSSDKYLSTLMDAGAKRRERAAMADTGLNDRQIAEIEAQMMIVGQYGQYDQSAGPDGACYCPPADNTAMEAKGISCGNCVFFLGPDESDETTDDTTTDTANQHCMLVAGNIDDDGVCKLWVIPQGSQTDSDDMSPPTSTQRAAMTDMMRKKRKGKQPSPLFPNILP